MEKSAMLMFFVHIALAFAVYVSPAMYFFERNLLGFYQNEPEDDEEKMTTKYNLQSSPAEDAVAVPKIARSERMKSILLRTSQCYRKVHLKNWLTLQALVALPSPVSSFPC